MSAYLHNFHRKGVLVVVRVAVVVLGNELLGGLHGHRQVRLSEGDKGHSYFWWRSGNPALRLSA